MKYLYFIFRLFFSPRCRHNYKYESEIQVFDGVNSMPIAYKKIYTCKKCGNTISKTF